MQKNNDMQKALRLNEIDAAVNKFVPVTPEHPFYVNFENLRGDFQERDVMLMLNEGKSAQDARAYIDTTYSKYGRSNIP